MAMKSVYLPFLDLVTQPLDLLLKLALPLLGCLDISFQFRLKLPAGGLEVGKLGLEQIAL